MFFVPISMKVVRLYVAVRPQKIIWSFDGFIDCRRGLIGGLIDWLIEWSIDWLMAET